MKKITERRGTYYIERKGRMWAKILSGVLLVIWLLLVFIPAAGAVISPWAALLGSIFLLIPAALLSYIPGRSWRRKVAAIIDGRDVPGGAWLAVMDARNEKHELVVDQALALDLARSLSGPKH